MQPPHFDEGKATEAALKADILQTFSPATQAGQVKLAAMGIVCLIFFGLGGLLGLIIGLVI